MLQETADLSLRVGLNSGPTTAGVLRGEKARFQLFGDVRSTREILSFVSQNYMTSHSINFYTADCKYSVSDGEQRRK